MNKGFIFRRLIQLICLEGLLYWGLDYVIDWKFWTASLCFLSVTIIWIIVYENDVIRELDEVKG